VGVPRKPAVYGGPIEEFAQPSDITKSELQQRPERSLPSDPHRPVGEYVPQGEERVHPSEEPVRTDVGGRTPLDPTRRGVSAGEGTVQPELGRVPGLLERKLSRRERKAFASEVVASRNAPRNQAYG
jgi:hypothetical protein